MHVPSANWETFRITYRYCWCKIYTVLLNSILGIKKKIGGHICRYNNKARLKIYLNLVSYFVADSTNRVKGCPQNMMKRSSDSKFWFWFYRKHLINSLHRLQFFCMIYQEIRNTCVNFVVASSLRFAGYNIIHTTCLSYFSINHSDPLCKLWILSTCELS